VSEHGTLNVLVCAPIIGRDLGPLRAVSERVHIVDGNEAFARYRKALRDGDDRAGNEALGELQRLLRGADVLCMMYPMLSQVRPHAPRLQWLHHTMAGVSNLWSCDLWNDPHVLITSGRGHVNATAIAEYAIAAVLAFARGMHGAFLDKQAGALNRNDYELTLVAGATLGVIGLGGIGREVARLGRALGMRVVGTRRSIAAIAADTDEADVVYPAARLHEMAAQCDHVVICTQLTAETIGLIDERFFRSLERRPLLVNVSRGEVIDEAAMSAALGESRIRGAVLDVYAGELEGKPPRPEWLSLPNVLLTPHIAGLGGGRDPAMMDLFRENLRRYVHGEPLLNRVDRERGY
jgi:D-2-hydroxyacid dehydrogenase (NADP+)